MHIPSSLKYYLVSVADPPLQVCIAGGEFRQPKEGVGGRRGGRAHEERVEQGPELAAGQAVAATDVLHHAGQHRQLCLSRATTRRCRASFTEVKKESSSHECYLTFVAQKPCHTTASPIKTTLGIPAPVTTPSAPTRPDTEDLTRPTQQKCAEKSLN